MLLSHGTEAAVGGEETAVATVSVISGEESGKSRRFFRAVLDCQTC